MNPANSAAVPGWRSALPALLLCLAWILFWYRDTAIAMVTIWTQSGTFAHAFLVPPISLWLIWRQRHALATLSPRASFPVLILLALAGFIWLLGDLAAVNAVTQLALVSLLVLAVPAVLGMRVAAAMTFPLAFLFFAVPIGEFVMPQLMEWTADFTVRALTLTGIPVYREGLQFIIPSGAWSIVRACSGVRYLIASVVVGTLYAYLSYRSPRKRLIFIGVSFIVPIIANWVRAYLIVMIGHLSGNRLAVGVDHLIYGWIFFGIVMVILYMIGSRWADNPDPNELPSGRYEPTGVPASRRNPWLAAAAVAVITVLPQTWNWVINQPDLAGSPTLLMPAIEGWQPGSPSAIDWRPTFTGPSAELRSVLHQGDREVGIFIGYYRQQTYERKLITSDNVLVMPANSEWAQVASGSREIAFAGRPLEVRTAELRGSDGQRLMTWQWYWINGRLTSSDYVGKAYTALARLLGQGDDSAVVVLFAPKEGAGGGESTLQAFAQSAGGAIETALRNADEKKAGAQ